MPQCKPICENISKFPYWIPTECFRTDPYRQEHTTPSAIASVTSD